jgi:hypothetical protein
MQGHQCLPFSQTVCPYRDGCVLSRCEALVSQRGCVSQPWVRSLGTRS